jgi:hypothetical protein
MYKARCKIYDNMSMQPEFVKVDKELRRKVLALFEKDKKFEEAKKNWSTWDADERFDFLRYCAQKQCSVMGQPVPEVVKGTMDPRNCSNSLFRCTGATYKCEENGCVNKGNTWIGNVVGTTGYNCLCSECNKVGDPISGCVRYGKTWSYAPSDQVTCPDCGRPSYLDAERCKQTWPNTTGKGGCPNPKCGGVDTGNSVEFGGCNSALLYGGDKSKITLNPHDNVLGDFEESFNTIMHENAHSYQDYLVKRYREDKVKLFKEIPYAKEIEDQIIMFDENNEGYVSSGPTYDKQPVEEHAWKFGNKTAQKKLSPKPKLNFGEKPSNVKDL